MPPNFEDMAVRTASRASVPDFLVPASPDLLSLDSDPEQQQQQSTGLSGHEAGQPLTQSRACCHDSREYAAFQRDAMKVDLRSGAMSPSALGVTARRWRTDASELREGSPSADCVCTNAHTTATGTCTGSTAPAASARPALIADRILLVGAGPGDPDLLTLAAHKALMRADLVVSDRLIPQAILDMVPCELRIARKFPGRADAAQDELNDWCLDALGQGKTVVRLKIGDPFLFGRGGEEVLFFRKHGYECKVIPGVSSCLSAPLVAGIPPTHRGTADQVLVVTGQGKHGTIPELPTYSPTRTTVFLMALGRLSQLCEGLVKEAGFPHDCPAAVVERATLPTQRVLRGDLSTIAAICAAEGVKPPACMVVGKVVAVLGDDGVGAYGTGAGGSKA